MKMTELEKRVKARQAFLVRLISFAQEVIPKLGRRTHYRQGSANTHEIHMLTDFHGFDIELSTGHNMMGGNHTKIWLHPSTGPQGNLVLHLYWQSNPNEVIVEFLVKEDDWQQRLHRLIGQKKRLLAQGERTKKANAHNEEKARRAHDASRIIEKRAKELGLIAAG